jgi:bifunctional non-homologous end joining protein LigD
MNVTSIEISNPEKKIFTRYTKKNFVDYHETIASFMLPHIEKRPLTLYRFPDGAGTQGFYQKNMSDYFPHWIDHTVIRQKEGAVDYVICSSKQSLVYIASQVAELHPWTSKIGTLNYPDKMIFDLDPSSKNLDPLKKVARKLGKLLKDVGLQPYLMTTGKKGYHITAPVQPEQKNKAVREFALKIATVLEQDDPETVTTELFKDKRKKRVFIDVNRNSPHQTSIAPYSVRAVKKATVALPIKWSELGTVNPGDYDIGRTLKRMQKKQDPWKDFREKSESVQAVIGRLKQ